MQQAGLEAVKFLGADHPFVPQPHKSLQFLPQAFRRQPGVHFFGVGLQGQGAGQGQGSGPPRQGRGQIPGAVIPQGKGAVEEEISMFLPFLAASRIRS